jgi:SNF2 family DNA or RNA helicase
VTTTYGDITYQPHRRAWCIEAAPHVVIRLKRVFQKIDQNAHGALTLSDTLENAAELAWFLKRYPMKVERRKYLAERSKAYIQQHERLNLIADGKYDPRPFELALPLRGYQATAAELALQAGGLILGDDLGLGKTAAAIGAISDPAARPALVVTLTHLPRQWEAEIRKFAPGLRTHILKTGSPYAPEAPWGGILEAMRPRRRRKDATAPALSEASDVPDVVICNYHKLGGWADVLAGKVRSVVFDECQELRHQGTSKYEGARHIADAAELRLALSATPIYNYGSEIFNVTKVVRPMALGTYDEFTREWCVSGSSNDGHRVRDPKALGIYLREQSLMLRRTRKDVGRELPPVVTVPHFIDCDEEPLKAVEGAAAELARIILTQGGQRRGEKLRASEELSWRLRQATGIAKAPHVAAFVEMLVQQGEKVLLTGWHREVYSIWQERLADLKPAMFTGSESPTQKAASVEAFVRGDAQVLIMSLRAGAGLDGLQEACHVVVNGELDWSPKVHDQVHGRLHRDGQDEPVLAYFMLTESGSDPVVADVLGLKRQQSEGIVNPYQSAVEPLDVNGGEQNIRRLAETYLRQRGLELPAAAPADENEAEQLAAGGEVA